MVLATAAVLLLGTGVAAPEPGAIGQKRAEVARIQSELARIDGEVFNLFDNQKLVSWNTSIVPVTGAGAPVDNLGLPTTYRQGPLFGQGRLESNYPVPFPGQTGGRTLRLSFGIRF